MKEYKIGVISDTHGLLRENVSEIFKGCDLIIHAGDIGGTEIIENLEKVAPVVAVKGNCDRGEWSYKLKKTQVIEFGETLIYVIHNSRDVDIDLKASGFKVLISGHSHNPSSIILNNILFLNPGSAGPRRFNLPISVAILNIDKGKVYADLIELDESR